jgi:protocatechuate 3,4-dioxygenase beta subunit
VFGRDRDALAEGYLVSDQNTDLDVRVAQSASVVYGRVVDNEGKPVDRAAIVLAPQGALAPRADKENTHRVTTTNLKGTFEIRNVIPGTYRAYALAKIEEGSHLDATVFKPFDEQSTRVDVTRDAKVSVELQQIP